MSDESSTASIARSVISEANNTPAESPVSTTAHNNAFAQLAPHAALSEVRALAGDNASKTKLFAAMNVARSDPRKTVMTTDGHIRREHDPNGSRTSEIAREMLDIQAGGGLNREDPDSQRNARSKAVHDYVRQIFREANEQAPPEDMQAFGTEAWHDAADNLLDLIIKHGREMK